MIKNVIRSFNKNKGRVDKNKEWGNYEEKTEKHICNCTLETCKYSKINLLFFPSLCACACVCVCVCVLMF